jgi:mannitol/fructose-specific phosphotransferase system IIA component (Ntr-type)
MFDVRRVNPDLQASDVGEAVAELIAGAVPPHRIRDAQALIRSLRHVSDERLFIAGGGADDPAIALIHAGSEWIVAPFASLGLSRKGILVGSPSGNRAHAIVALMFPAWEVAASVWGMARLARWLRKREARALICQPTSAPDAIRQLERVWRGTPEEEHRVGVTSPP